MESQTLREKWVSDAATYDKVIELYENKGDNPLFVFDVTIQNHAGYQLNADDLEPVLLEGMEEAILKPAVLIADAQLRRGVQKSDRLFQRSG